jgi:hypothetical protein
MSHKQLLPLLVLLGVLPTVGFAQAPNPPLNFGNNFLVTGDYVVAGAYGMTTIFETRNGVTYAVGTISVPDSNNGIPNPGITGTKQVPAGAQIVAALLYWQTVEKAGVAPGGPGSGQNGFFRPLLYKDSGGPVAPGYAISGTNIIGSNTVAWSSGGCGGPGGKVIRTYRADVAGGLPVDVNGNPIANGSFEVRLPSVGNSTPLTLGATLVIIYRISAGANGPTIPLNSIVIYDGDYAQANAQLTMTQKLQGFYDADGNPVSRLTHIVGSGQSNKFQTVYLSSGLNSFVALPSLYGNGSLPAFPGYYGSWDNPTWTFTNPSINPPNPGVMEDASYATTQVVPSSSNQGCVSWGAVIVSTTVKNPDNDGILYSWKTNQGYCDYSVNASCSLSTDPGWVPLPEPHPGSKDVYLQYDYMCSSVQGPASSANSCALGGPKNDYSFDPRLATDPADLANPTAIDKVVAAYANHNINLHAIPGNAIEENQDAITCTDSSPNPTCPFPNEPGTVGFREGLTYIKNQIINPNTGVICNPGTAGCLPVFQHGKKDSYHYALFSHGVGLPSWFLSDGSISSVSQSGSTVTFTTSSPHGISPIAGDSLCSAPKYGGRVTVVFAITNPNLNGTFCAQNVTSNTFQITVGGSSTTPTYTSKTDPNLAVANGQVTSMSGFSDVGGQNSVISLGYGGWGPPANDGNTWQVKAGTFMHELGHTLGLTHGGTFYSNLNNKDYTPIFEPNCKPNLQSVMNYQFQVDLLVDKATGHQVVDYSKLALPDLMKSSPQQPGVLSPAPYANTAWFQLTDYVHSLNPSITPNVMGAHCDGTPRLPGDPDMTYVSGAAGSFFSSSANPNTGLDINYDGHINNEVLHGHNEWDGEAADIGLSPGLDLQQISAVGTITTIGLGGEAGALKPAGGGGALHPAGGGGALKPAGGGGALKPAGGGGLKGDITHETANSYARPPRNLTATEDSSPRLIHLSWTVPTFGQIDHYTIYRSDAGAAFKSVGSSNQTAFQDTVPCNSGGYSYEVTASVNSETGLLESLPSNVVPVGDKLTGCYLVPSFSSPASAANNSLVPITWTLTDDFYPTGGSVTRQAANTLFAIGPLPGNCKKIGATTILSNGVPQSGAGTFTNSGNQFTFTWNTKAFCAGSYTFQLKLDSNQSQTTTTPLQLK